MIILVFQALYFQNNLMLVSTHFNIIFYIKETHGDNMIHRSEGMHSLDGLHKSTIKWTVATNRELILNFNRYVN